MRQILLYEDFTKLFNRWYEGGLRKEEESQVREIAREFISNQEDPEIFSIDKDGKVNAKGDVIIECKDLIDNKLPCQFGNVSGDFDASFLELYNLEFMPKYVGGDFNISVNKLKSFVGCPDEVNGDFIATDCYNLESLKGLPKHIGGNLTITTPEKQGKFTKDDIPEGTVIKGTIKLSIRRKGQL